MPQKLEDLPIAVQKQLMPAIKASKRKLTTEQRRANGKKAWQTRLERAEKKEPTPAKTPEEVARETEQ